MTLVVSRFERGSELNTSIYITCVFHIVLEALGVADSLDPQQCRFALLCCDENV